MNFTASFSAALVLTIGATTYGTAQTVLNAKILHNTQHTDITSRVSNNAVDTIYYMQPALSHTGYGKAKGWRGVLQDADYNTAERVQFAFVRYAASSDRPDVTNTGLISNASANLQFPKPASGVVSAATWTLTLNTAATVPTHHGLRLVFPAPASANDGVFVHTQRGRTSQIPSSLRKQYTWNLDAQGQATGFWETATTLFMGVFYEQPVTQMFVSSNRYGKQEDLFGLEALLPESTAGDRVGFAMTGDQFKNQISVLLISGGLAKSPIQAGIGTLFLIPPFGLIQLPFVLDKDGVAKSPAVPVPGGLKIWTQSAFFDAGTGRVRMSDATGIEVQ